MLAAHDACETPQRSILPIPAEPASSCPFTRGRRSEASGSLSKYLSPDLRYRLNYRARIPGIVIAILLVTSVMVVPMQRAFAGSAGDVVPVTNADGRLGLCDVLVGSPVSDSGPTWAQLAYSAGARTNRWEFRMDKLEATPGAWNFAATDSVVSNDTAHGLDTEGILIGTPAWAIGAGQTPGNGLPRGLNRAVTDPANVWADYVRQTVHHYAGQVAYWEIWNEPDLKFFWTSSPADYYHLLKVSYTVIKAVDPLAKVVLAGMVVPDFKFLSAVLDAAKADPTSRAAHGYFDIAAWHAYGATKQVYPNLTQMQALLSEHGYGAAPIWVTEAGFPASNPNGESRQAAYVFQAIAYAFAAGADRVFVYRASDDPTPKTWGMLSADGVPRQAYTAFSVAAQYLSHVQAATYDPTADAERFVFYTPQNRISLLWNHATVDRSVSLSAGQRTGKMVDWQGNVTPLSASLGLFHFTAPGATYNQGVDPTGSVVGGPPSMIIESNSRPATLGAPAYIPPVVGTHRQLVVLNDAAVPSAVEVSVPGNAWKREELQLRPHAVQYVDLDLLGGPAYAGLFRVSSSTTVTAQALSGPVSVPGISPAGLWSVTAAPAALVLSNPTGALVSGQITAYGYGGKVRLRQNVAVPPFDSVRWTSPDALRGQPLSLSIASRGKFLVSGISGPLTNAVAQPRDTWYTVAPQASKLVMFNPLGSTPARVHVRYVGSVAGTNRQIRLGGHRSYIFPTHAARTVVVSATHPITLGYLNSAGVRSSIGAEPAMRTALTAGGVTTSVSVYNPSQQAARVTVSVVGRTGTSTVTRLAGPTGVLTIPVRKTSDSPRGVVVTSTIPVVSAPSSYS